MNQKSEKENGAVQSPQNEVVKDLDIRSEIEKSLEQLQEGEDKDEVVEHIVEHIVEHREMFSGPLPPPELLERYEAAYPGAIQKIFDMAEANNNAGIELRKTDLKAQIDYRNYGLFVGFVSFLAVVAATVLLGVYDKPIIAGTILGVGAVTAIGKFVDGRQRQTNKDTKKTHD